MDQTMDQPLTHSQPPQWIWIAAIWSGVGLFDATQTVFSMRAEGMHHAWRWLFLTLLVEWLPWPLSTWLRHFFACMAINLVFSAWAATLEKLTNPYAEPTPWKFLPLLSAKFY